MSLNLLQQRVMAETPFLPKADVTVTTEPLTDGEREEVLAFLSEDPLNTIIMAGLVRDNGIASARNRGTFWGCRNSAGRLEGVALVGHHTLIEAPYVRAPIPGVVLRRRLKAGESYSIETQDAGRASIFTLADTSTLHVRVDVDERDVGRVLTGQTAYMTADTYGDRRFTGRVVSVGQVMGRKNVRTEEPTERVDTKILEVLVELDSGQRLPPGLRVDAFILINSK
jgi:hypothetical protein